MNKVTMVKSKSNNGNTKKIKFGKMFNIRKLENKNYLHIKI